MKTGFEAAPKFEWRMPAIVDRVIDGDTIEARIHVMPGMMLYGEHVRVEGINAPEMNTRAGIDAKNFAWSLLMPENGTIVTLTMTGSDKYGRVLARVILPDGRDFGHLMITNGHAVAYMV